MFDFGEHTPHFVPPESTRNRMLSLRSIETSPSHIPILPAVRQQPAGLHTNKYGWGSTVQHNLSAKKSPMFCATRPIQRDGHEHEHKHTSQSSQCLAGSYFTRRETDTSSEFSSEGSMGENLLSFKALKPAHQTLNRSWTGYADTREQAVPKKLINLHHFIGCITYCSNAGEWMPRRGQNDIQTQLFISRTETPHDRISQAMEMHISTRRLQRHTVRC